MSDNETPAGDTRKCPYCAEWIKAEATVCRYCGRDVTPTVTADAEPQATSESETQATGESEPPAETSIFKRKPWLIFVIVGAVVLVGALVAVLLTRSAYSVPEMDAVADTWEKRGPQFRQDVCARDWSNLAEATAEDHPNEYLEADLWNASRMFLRGHAQYEDGALEGLYEEGALFLDRGVYLNSYAVEAQQARTDEYVAEMKAEGEEIPSDFERDAEESWKTYLQDEGEEYLGTVTPPTDPCVDFESDD